MGLFSFAFIGLKCTLHSSIVLPKKSLSFYYKLAEIRKGQPVSNARKRVIFKAVDGSVHRNNGFTRKAPNRCLGENLRIPDFEHTGISLAYLRADQYNFPFFSKNLQPKPSSFSLKTNNRFTFIDSRERPAQIPILARSLCYNDPSQL